MNKEILTLTTSSSLTLGNSSELDCTRSIVTFTNPDFGQIRTATDEMGEPLFCLNDVCRALELEGKQVNRRLSDEVVSKHPITDSLGRTQLASFVNEDGLYDVILDSRKAEARRFRKWVTSVVLPQIRKTGGYIPMRQQTTDNGQQSDAEILSRALLIAQKTIELKNDQLANQAPKVRFADAVTECEDSILIHQLAKMITQNGFTIGQNRLFEWMKKNGYLFKRNGNNSPAQKWVERGLFTTTVTLIETHHGSIERITTRVTGKGQEYFVNGFLSGEFIL